MSKDPQGPKAGLRCMHVVGTVEGLFEVTTRVPSGVVDPVPRVRLRRAYAYNGNWDKFRLANLTQASVLRGCGS